MWRFLRRIIGIEILIAKADANMTKVKDVLDELVTLKEVVTAEAAEVKATITLLTEQMTALRAQLDAGGAVTPADLDSMLAQIKDLEAGVSAIVTPVEPPA